MKTNNEKWQGNSRSKSNTGAGRDGKPFEKRDVKSILKGSRGAAKYNTDRPARDDSRTSGSSDYKRNDDSRPAYGDHAFRFRRRHRGISGAVKGPDRQPGQLGFVRKQRGDEIAAAANRRDGRKAFRMAQAEAPRPESAHAESGQINPVRVHGISAFDVIQKREQQIIRPDFPGGALRRNDDERQLGGSRDFWWAVLGDQPDVGAALAGAV